MDKRGRNEKQEGDKQNNGEKKREKIRVLPNKELEKKCQENRQKTEKRQDSNVLN